MRTLKIILNVLKWILFAIVVLLLVNNIYKIVKSAGGERMPKFLGFASAVVVSDSMNGDPAYIKINDVVLVHERSEYKEGDIIMFFDGSDYVTHRIVEAVDGGFRTKGDNPLNSIDKDIVKKENIVGAVYATLPQFGVVSGFISTPMGAFCIAVVALIIIFVPDVISYLINKNKKEENKNE